MTTRYVDFPTPIRITGIATRTTNARESDPATAQLGALWGRFMGEDSKGAKDDSPYYSVYTEYESDVNGAYTVVIGRESKSPSPGGKNATIPAGRYAEFKSSGEMPAAVIAGWQQVWAFFSEPGSPQRSYKADFERYDPASPDTVWIYVGVNG